MSFDSYVKRMCEEARHNQLHRRRFGSQLPPSVDARNNNTDPPRAATMSVLWSGHDDGKQYGRLFWNPLLRSTNKPGNALDGDIL